MSLAAEKTDPHAHALSSLKKQYLFYGLDDADYDNILTISSLRDLQAGEVLFKEGDGSFGMYILLTGDIRLKTEKDGEIHAVQPGEIFGEMGAIAHIRRTASAIVRRPSLLMQFNHSQLMELLNRYPHIGFKVMSNICTVLIKRLVK